MTSVCRSSPTVWRTDDCDRTVHRPNYVMPERKQCGRPRWRSTQSYRPSREINVIGWYRTSNLSRQGAALDVAWEILARHSAAKPAGGMGDMSIIRGEINRQNRHMPLRKLMERAGPTIQKIKPVFLISPLSVAQFLPPGKLEFDLLVIDEASQVKPEDALGRSPA